MKHTRFTSDQIQILQKMCKMNVSLVHLKGDGLDQSRPVWFSHPDHGLKPATTGSNLTHGMKLEDLKLTLKVLEIKSNSF